jgi:gliding motility-associated-like protein
MCAAGLWAQPANDDCANAISLSVGSGLCEANVYSNALSTSVSDPIPPLCWGSGFNNSVWFTFVAPGPAVRVSTNFAQTVIDTKIAVYSGSCGTLALVGCQKDVFAIENERKNSLLVTGLTAGQTYYLVVDSDGGSGNFAVCIERQVVPTPCSTPGQDCGSAFYVTNTNALVIPSGSLGAGTRVEPTQCTVDEENTLWLKFYAVSGGRLAFTVTPNTPVNIDYAVYDVTQGCQGSPLALPQGCNSNTATTNGGTVGWNCPPSICGTNTCTGASLNCPDGLSITAGQTYGLMIDRKASNTGLIVTFSGITSQPGLLIGMPKPRFASSLECDGNAVRFTNFNDACHFAYSWDFGDGSTSYQPNPQHQYEVAGTYEVVLTLTDLNTGVTSMARQNVTITPGPTVATSPSTPALPYDIAVCAGGQVNMTGTVQALPSTTTGELTFGNFEGGPVAGTDTYFPIAVTQVLPNTVTASTVKEVCLNIATLRSRDLVVLLQNPAGGIDTLINRRGALNSTFLSGVCIRPGASAWPNNPPPATPPQVVTGTFRVDNPTLSSTGLWAGILGSEATGTWNLIVKDDNVATPASLLDWSITFNVSSSVNEIVDIVWEADNGGSVSFGAPTLNPATGTGSSIATAYPFSSTRYIMRAFDAVGCSSADTVRVRVADASINVTKTDVTAPGGCDGTATATATGQSPFPPYTFEWRRPNGTLLAAPGISGLCSGTYKVYSIDSRGCRDSTTYVILEPAVGDLRLNSLVTQPACQGDANGQISITPAAGTAPYTYTWTGPIPLPDGLNLNQQANLPPGQYKAVVLDSSVPGVRDSVVVTLLDPAPLDAIITNSAPVRCFGGNNGTASVDATGGTLSSGSDYTFLWKRVPAGTLIGQFGRTATGLAAGTYRAVVTDQNGCKDSVDVVITQPATPLAISLNSTTPTSCFGLSDGAASVTASGGNGGYTYLWTPGNEATASVSGKPAGNYTVTVRDGENCVQTRNVTISGPTAISVNTFSQTNVGCNGDNSGSFTLNATGGAGGYTYRFTRQPSNATLQNGPSNTLGSLGVGSYRVEVTDANGCRAQRDFSITQPATLTLSSSQVNPSVPGASDGSITQEPAGGTPPYTYRWETLSGTPIAGTSASLTNRPAGFYRAIVRDASGCERVLVVELLDPDVLRLTVATSGTLCPGDASGEALATAAGGAAPYTFAWSKVPGPLPSGFATTNPTADTERATGLDAGTYTVAVTDDAGTIKSVTFVLSQNPALSPTAARTNVSCFGLANGTASVNPNGGTPPYTYSWSGPGSFSSTSQTLSALQPGTYTATVTDALGCTGLASATITQPAAAVSITNISSTNLTCNGSQDGVLSVTASGGTPNTTGPAYSYLWQRAGSPVVYTTATANNLPAGTYTITVTDANGCTASSTTSLSQPSPITIARTITPVSCQGGTNGAINITPAGGNAGGYTYLWTPGGQTTQDRNNLAAGTYKVVVRDPLGCKDSAFITVLQSPALLVNIQQNNVSCNGGNDGRITVRASGGVPLGGASPYTYAISPTAGTVLQDSIFQNLPVGTYTVTATDANGCSTSRQTIVTMPGPISLQTTQTSATAAGGTNGMASVLVEGGQAPYTYDWSNDGTGDNNDPVTITGLGQGTYTVRVTDANGCTANANIQVTETTGGAIVATAFTADASCSGATDGAASINVTGGLPPYSFVWTPNVSTSSYAGGLSTTTTYAVVVNDAGPAPAVTLTGITITAPTAITLAVANDALDCHSALDGSLSATVSGGTPPYSYSWVSAQYVGVRTTPSLTGLAAGTYILTVTDQKGCNTSTSAQVTQPADLAISVSFVDNNDCFSDNSGSVVVTPSGGTGPYTYRWSPGGYTTASVNNLTAGIYKVVVRDQNSCKDSVNVTVGEPAQLSLSVQVSNVSCSGGNTGAAGVDASGGTPPYAYLWKNLSNPAFTVLGTDTVANLPTAIYRVIVTDDNGCRDSVAFQIFQPNPLQLQLTQDPISCHDGADGSLSVLASGGIPGTGGYTYRWFALGSTTTLVGTAATQPGLAAGTYRVRVTDSRGCSDSIEVTLANPPAFVLDKQTTLPICPGDASGALAVSASGGSGGFSFLWADNGATTAARTGLPAGSYKVYVTDATGCRDSVVLSLPNPAPITLLITDVQPSTGLANGRIQILDASGQSDPSTLTLSGVSNPGFGPLSVGPASEPYPAFEGLPPGTYSLRLTDADGCQTLSNFEISRGDLILDNLVPESCRRNDGAATVRVERSKVTGTLNFTWTRLPSGTVVQQASTADTFQVALNLPSGAYRVRVRDQAGFDETLDFFIAEGPRLLVRPDYALCTNPGEPVADLVDLASPAPTLGGSPVSGTWAAFDPAGNPVSNLTGSAFVADAPGIFIAVFTEATFGCQDTVRLFFGPLDAGRDTIACVSATRRTFQIAEPFGIGVWSSSNPAIAVLDPVKGIFDLSSATPPLGFVATLTAPSATACSDDVLVQVEAGPEPGFSTRPQLPGQVLNLPAADVILQNTTRLNGATAENCLWDMGDGTVLRGCTDQIAHRYTRPGTYTICLTVDVGFCDETYCLQNVVVSEEAYFTIPEVFTPNGDGVNDLLRVTTSNLRRFELLIYDRYGKQVFSTTRADEGWDGTINGADAPTNSYFWIVRATDLYGTEIEDQGTVAIIR